MSVPPGTSVPAPRSHSAPAGSPHRSPRARRFVAGIVTTCFAAAAAVLSSSATAHADTQTVTRTVTITADQDSFDSTVWRNSHFGALTHLTTGTYLGNTRHTYLHFTRPAGTVVSAHLILHRSGVWTPSTLIANATSVGFSEATLNHLTAPAAQRYAGWAPVVSTSTTTSLNVTAEFAAHLSSTLIVGDKEGRIVQFASRQATYNRPQLSVVISQPVTPACTVTTKLVPTCGRWWGAGMAFSPQPLATKLAQAETLAQRPDDIVHTYHVNDQLFPTADEKAVALQPGHHRLLLINWKPATDMSWAAVANGGADHRIDNLANHIKATFPYRFFLTIYHEPEDNVNMTAGSGMTAADYAAMYRHTVLRLRQDGVTNAVTVVNFMGFDPWAQQSWFGQLWPGDDVVDWIGLDPYGTGATSGYSARDFTTLVNRPSTGFPGYYSWATKTHPGKPIMLCEWGVRYDATAPAGQANFFNSMHTELGSYPAIKGLLYFDVPAPAPTGEPLTDPTLNPTALSAYRSIARSTLFATPSWTY